MRKNLLSPAGAEEQPDMARVRAEQMATPFGGNPGTEIVGNLRLTRSRDIVCLAFDGQ